MESAKNSGDVNLIERFDEWVEGLPSEHRLEAYMFADSLLMIGKIQGEDIEASRMKKISSAEDYTAQELESAERKHKMCLAHLRKKKKELIT